MNRIKSELSKIYLRKILEKQELPEQVHQFIDQHLKREERFILLKEFLKALANDHKIVQNKDDNNSKKCDLSLDEEILHLYTIQSSPMVAPIASNRKKKEVVFLLSIIVTKDNKLILLKCLKFADELSYSMLHLDLNDEKPFAEESFFVQYIPEFLYLTSNPSYHEELYFIKKALYKEAIKYIIYYSEKADLEKIKQGLQINNGNIEIERVGKKMLIIKYDQGEKIVQYVECDIQLNKKKYRTRHTPYAKEGIDAFIIKAREPETNISHYIYVSNVKKEVRNCMLDKRERLHVSALFSKNSTGFELDKKIVRNSVLKYENINEVILSDSKKEKRSNE